MHTYKTVRRQMRNNLATWCFPKSSIVFVEEIERPGGTSGRTTVRTENAGVKPAHACIRIVKPSEWARLDVCTYPFYADVYENPSRDHLDHLSIEQAPMVHHRFAFTSRDQVLWSTVNGVPCITSAGDTVSIPCSARPICPAQGRKVHQAWMSETATASASKTYTFSVIGVVVGTWMIGSSTTSPARPHHCTDSWTDNERATQRLLSTPTAKTALGSSFRSGDRSIKQNIGASSQSSLSFSRSVIELHPGDICVLLRSDHQPEDGQTTLLPTTSQHCVLIGSLIRQATGESAERLVWVDSDNTLKSRTTLHFVATSNVSDMPVWLSGRDRSAPAGYELGKACDRGFLPDGTRYVVYRFALYMDGFKQTKAQRDTRSVGGCYMIPLGLSAESRRSPGAPRVLTIASSSLSHNKVMSLVLEDVWNTAKDGVDGVDPYGRKIRIFLDAVTFFGDFPAVALCTDVYGHTGNACCSLCMSRKRRRTNGARIVCTPMRHSRRIGFWRSDARMDAIREWPYKADTYRSLGMKSRSVESSRTLPLVELSSKLASVGKASLNDVGQQVVPTMFESCLSCAAVPDHMVDGLIKNVLSLLFDSVQDDKRRESMEIRIASTARENGLPVTGNILRWDRDGYAGLMSQTMTTNKCILLCAAPAFDEEFRRSGIALFQLARSLQRFVALVYFWPALECDGADYARMLTAEGRMDYYGDLIIRATDFIKLCDKVIVEDSEAGAILDKPNAHRAIELVVHTIPSFGHATNASEMVLESMHQVFKGWLEKNPHPTAHLTAVERALARDWMGRAFSQFKIWRKGNSKERACSEVGLRRLFLGWDGVHLDDSREMVQEFKHSFREEMATAFKEPVLSMMRDCAHISLPGARRYVWEVLHTDKVGSEEPMDVVREGRSLLARMFRLRPGFESRDLTWYACARFAHSDVYEDRKRVYTHHLIKEGAVISAVGLWKTTAAWCGSSRLVVRR